MSTDPAHRNHDHEHPSASDCVDFLEQIVYFIDNELDEADCAAVRLHLDTCNPCLAKYDLQRTVKAVVARSCSETAPAELRARVMMRVRQVQIEIRES
ncbi:mycothiol system anti-sigma-R factor [Nocardioides acrostichi]|uniref:Mycothiol system anti-sigma-R factor n=1 Tax=Nocardioides acrostichi TaxID=2784339 RepID=A0A930UU39_9ACTN|nr:mycothiol system anti-sigma-R factor [Nocardioides acrostichi]MBF4160873.1 mycothiol system anti-sigma-R factor [Nocardioides acrostichi]